MQEIMPKKRIATKQPSNAAKHAKETRGVMYVIEIGTYHVVLGYGGYKYLLNRSGGIIALP